MNCTNDLDRLDQRYKLPADPVANNSAVLLHLSQHVDQQSACGVRRVVMCARSAWMATRILTRERALVSTTATLSTATLSAATLITAVNWPFSVLPLYAWGGGGGA